MWDIWQQEVLAHDQLRDRRREAERRHMAVYVLPTRRRRAAAGRELGWLENGIFMPGFPIFSAGAWAFELAFEPPETDGSRGSLIL